MSDDDRARIRQLERERSVGAWFVFVMVLAVWGLLLAMFAVAGPDAAIQHPRGQGDWIAVTIVGLLVAGMIVGVGWVAATGLQSVVADWKRQSRLLRTLERWQRRAARSDRLLITLEVGWLLGVVLVSVAVPVGMGVGGWLLFGEIGLLWTLVLFAINPATYFFLVLAWKGVGYAKEGVLDL